MHNFIPFSLTFIDALQACMLIFFLVFPIFSLISLSHAGGNALILDIGLDSNVSANIGKPFAPATYIISLFHIA